MNTFKTFVFLLALSLILIYGGQLIGGQQGMVIALGLAVAMNFFSYWFSDKLVLMMYRAKEVSQADAPKVYRAVSNLTQRAGLPMPKIYRIPSESPNAFATGRGPGHAAVAVTESIERLLTDQEMEAVLAHELTHISNRDILISTIAATMASAIAVLASMARWAMILGGMNRSDDEDRGGNPLAMLAMVIILPLAATLIQLAVSRSREYLADEGAAKLTGHPRALASALKKLAEGVKDAPLENATPQTAHMFIMNPLRENWLMQLFSTHPSPARRIKRLEEMETGRGRG